MGIDRQRVPLCLRPLKLDLFQICAPKYKGRIQSCHTGRNGDALQFQASKKSQRCYARHFIRNHHTGQAGTGIESILSNGFQFCWKRHTFQTGTACKCTVADPCHAFRHRNTFQAGIFCKCMHPNACHWISTQRGGDLYRSANAFVFRDGCRAVIHTIFKIALRSRCRKRRRGQQGQQHGHRQKRAQDAQFGRGSGGLFFHFTRLLLVQENPKKKALWFDFTLPQSLQNSY